MPGGEGPRSAFPTSGPARRRRACRTPIVHKWSLCETRTGPAGHHSQRS
ncbi:hypothetical protein KCH_58140 [Kitasatospora cheerisanensis KCTC 2395]|uniref:Uncharacterized protein n=1 Tax=Kitasatospora cheerisanensis KCTC 2395 TaxID=1348663 RepID=A0A066YMD8_9ACTN|nr:hypothetical protein KCH_58140 [Kitasatospora cheerisanensis KCTC 2395]